MTAPTPSAPTDAEIIEALRAAAAKGLNVHPRVQPDLIRLHYDIEDVSEYVSDCDISELEKHEPDDKGRSDYIAVLKIEVEDEPFPFYVKVALDWPDMKRGKLLSFKYWGS